MQCKRQPSLTSDIQAGRALTLLSIILGILGFIIALLGGGVANCSGAEPDQSYYASNSRKKVLEFLFFIFFVEQELGSLGQRCHHWHRGG